ncbi:bifunctional tRNA (5-methylaminomethyl-2-thiouridine)(34)-methyltransferase MnmD/FAD-dependent 5-carboxymethylaminomethyl-2-thiouridine(34) oxidoreductase MnmC [Thiomicrorhabdus sediminis]|uniref:tRNA 5-methylaminomethyl-2-thiouridine biosynthesis bifunctional protein MnmC n=1 Tax=Thiomicrorhabdus sediminis TaxID=2580412 RepID=A0A4P9K331_9GAMM|nr:bifunctional tRNA (5-methylaminomethyl-2-thiouridine)(34)-methyltransferase MnmD/FAD-dependent 5-carboxymethylaminomethyl-2-thiouridine(34) oxidoreductase MnmC [Thiomicrorhabdus sediminis]QCU89225.1 bifunctional tRNA (5-methylaminomethyl-2-thiouridine)(34)-methyltransferase MnmD/FAD-dependent 5-carboxymethylaminomethyl-2-thiouridine(34) oxidoreductase MnmC [Thiomicrorhabdus sediminis]
MLSDKLTPAQVQWSNQSVPVSVQFDDVYFSTDDGLAESHYNFIDANRLQSRFSGLPPNAVFRIAETGFGSGLNFLLACRLWLQQAPSSANLHFISFEKFPLALADMQRAHSCFVELAEIAGELHSRYPLLLPGWHDVWLFEKRVRLTLWFGDVNKGLPELDATPSSLVDAWFLDGFAPAKNPDMWQTTLFQQMARLSHQQTSFATFTTAGDVRRSLHKMGFQVEKRPGYGKKREMCFGTLLHKRPFSWKTPWFERPEPIDNDNKQAIVIGAGLAGAAAAYQLAENGWQVTVLEQADDIATQASGNLAGAVHPLLTADWNLRSQWYLQGYEATLRHVLPWFNEAGSERLGDLSGLIQVFVDKTAEQRFQQAQQRVGLPHELVRGLNAEEHQLYLQGQHRHQGIIFPKGGWLYPRAVIERCLAHHNIHLQCGFKVSRLVFENESWRLDNGRQQYCAPVVIVATGSLEAKLNQQLGLPIRPVKGQVTHLQPEQQRYVLDKAVTHKGYSSPCHHGAVTGATFEAPNMDETLSLASHKENLAMAEQALPDWLATSVSASESSSVTEIELAGRVAFRPTTPDHLPIIGAVAQTDWMQKAYIGQSHTHAVYRYDKQRYQKGLYVSNGHGARGLMSVFLAAEILLAEIEGEALPQPLSLYHASHPARFAIRQWRQGKGDFYEKDHHYS